VPLVAAAAAVVAGLVALVSHVKTHTRKLPSGRTVPVHGHTRDDGGGMTEQQQDRRDRFGQRVQRERTRGLGSATTPGEKRRRKPGAKQMRKAKRHARKAMRLWRRHKVKAVAYGMLAGGEALSGVTRKGASGVRKLARSVKRKRRARRRRRK
jgi:hypothetical protein